MLRCAVFLVFALCISFVLGVHSHGSPPVRNGVPVIPCLTEDLHEAKRLANETCAQRGQCDIPAYRDIHGTSNKNIVLRTAIHVMNSRDGEAPDGVNSIQVSTLVNRLDKAFGSYGITFETTVYNHNDEKYYCIPAYSGRNQDWYDAINDMKTEYAVGVGRTLNIFISCQDSSLAGTLFGIGTFPWDSAAITATGGLWLNAISVNTTAQLEKDITVEHETGHCLGLWHTFHGSDEVIGCRFGCEEYPHSTIDPAANELGDFCADTPATPRNYACADPGGDACDGEAWGATDFTNYMGYGMDPEPCGNHFTNQQRSRMHCWICDALPEMAVSGC